MEGFEEGTPQDGFTSYSTGEIVTTIMVSNVPSHTTETEFNCWFLCAPGFEQATLRQKTASKQQQMGWARFSSVESADAVIQYLNGRSLTQYQSPECTVLSVQFAKSNFKPSNPGKKRDYEEAEMYTGTTVNRAPFKKVDNKGAATFADAQWTPPTQPTCSTLFLKGLNRNCGEDELTQFFAGQFDGFEKLKFTLPDDGKLGMCWVKFSSNEYAEVALQTINAEGYSLTSNPGVPLHVEFAKNDLDQPSKSSAQVAQALITPPAQPPVVEVPVPVPVPTIVSNAPCDTMFMGGLPTNVTEHELTDILSSLPGFIRLKIVGEGRPRQMAWVLFDSVAACAQAIQAVHGCALPSAPTQALECQYAKNSLDKPSRHRIT